MSLRSIRGYTPNYFVLPGVDGLLLGLALPLLSPEGEVCMSVAPEPPGTPGPDEGPVPPGIPGPPVLEVLGGRPPGAVAPGLGAVLCAIAAAEPTMRVVAIRIARANMCGSLGACPCDTNTAQAGRFRRCRFRSH